MAFTQNKLSLKLISSVADPEFSKRAGGGLDSNTKYFLFSVYFASCQKRSS